MKPHSNIIKGHSSFLTTKRNMLQGYIKNFHNFDSSLVQQL